MIRRPPRSTPLYSSAASDVYKRQGSGSQGGPGGAHRATTSLGERRRRCLGGTDTGTVVCPDADVKIFLTASITERACRRRAQLIEQGVDATQASLEREMQARDTTDSERTEAPLLKAADATELDTTDMNEDEVIEEILRIVNEHQTRA